MLPRTSYAIACLAAAGLTVVLASSNGFAQDTSTPTLKSLKLTCKDFKHSSDGSWVALHRVTVGGGTVEPGVPIGLGTVVGKVRLAGVLDSECLSH